MRIRGERSQIDGAGLYKERSSKRVEQAFRPALKADNRLGL